MKARLPFIFVAAVVVLCVVAATVAAVATGVSASAVAYSVNGSKVSQRTVDNELDWLAGNAQIRKNLKQQGQELSAGDGSINANVSATWLTQRIESTVLRQVAEQRDVKLTAADRAKVRAQLAAQTKGAPDSLRDTLVELSGYTSKLGLSSQNAFSAFVAKALRKRHVVVDPRYGTWHPARGVCPPSGCTG